MYNLIKFFTIAVLVIPFFANAGWTHTSGDDNIDKWVFGDGVATNASPALTLACNKESLVMVFNSVSKNGMVPYVEGSDPFGITVVGSDGKDSYWSPADMDFWKKDAATQNKFNTLVNELRDAKIVNVYFEDGTNFQFKQKNKTLPLDVNGKCKVGAPKGFIK